MATPNYQQIDAEAEEARKNAEKNAANNGWTGWDCKEAGLEAQNKVWKKYGVASPCYRQPLPKNGLADLDLDSLDD